MTRTRQCLVVATNPRHWSPRQWNMVPRVNIPGSYAKLVVIEHIVPLRCPYMQLGDGAVSANWTQAAGATIIQPIAPFSHEANLSKRTLRNNEANEPKASADYVAEECLESFWECHVAALICSNICFPYSFLSLRAFQGHSWRILPLL